MCFDKEFRRCRSSDETEWRNDNVCCDEEDEPFMFCYQFMGPSVVYILFTTGFFCFFVTYHSHFSYYNLIHNKN